MKTKEINSGNVWLADVSAVVPDLNVTQEEADRFVAQNFTGRLNTRSLGIFHKVLNHPSISKRHFAMDNLGTVIDESADKKIERFTNSAVHLSYMAAKEALSKTGLNAGDVDALVINTCTGYICPGLSTYVSEKLGLRADALSYDLVGSGCGGAVPNFQIANSLLQNDGIEVILSISVEICSSTFQMSDDPSQVISNSIFGDGATASVLWKRNNGLNLVKSMSRYLPEFREDIRFIHKGGQLHNKLSARLPGLAAKAVKGLVTDILDSSHLQFEDIKHWAIHPGGENIINAVKDELELGEKEMSHTRSVLLNYGNMSSPTSLFVLRHILDSGVKKGDLIMLVSFGAGFSAHAYLLKA